MVLLVLQGVGAVLLGNNDLKDASALLQRNMDAEMRWTCVNVIVAVEQGASVCLDSVISLHVYLFIA